MGRTQDQEVLFRFLRKSAEKLSTSLDKGKRQLDETLDKHPKVKALQEKVSRFASDKLEDIKDIRVNNVRLRDIGRLAQSLGERQLYRLVQRLSAQDPNVNWQALLSAQREMPVFAAFETLGLPYGTPFEEVKKHYRQLLRGHHPDKHADNPEAERLATEKTQAFTVAYELICKHYGR